MKSKIKITVLIIFAFTLLFINSSVVNAAGTASIGYNGNSTVSVGSNITLTLYISNVTGTNNNIGVVAAGGYLVFDSSYLQYVSGTNAYSLYNFSINVNNSYKIGALDTSGTSGIGRASDGGACTGTSTCSVMTFVFKALKTGATPVSFTVDKLYDDVSAVTTTSIAKTITITDATATKSSVATLSSLGVTGYTISPTFNSSTTSYTLTVPNSQSSVTLTGAATSSVASVTGLGSKALDVGSNTLVVTVTAENGTTKNYTLTVTREASSSTATSTPKSTTTTTKSSDNYLSSISSNLGYEIYPEFNKNTSSYTVTVPNNVNTLNLKATSSNSKAKVVITGDKDFVVGKTNVVTITVTAEDGSTRTYSINVIKSSLSSNTDLSSITVNDGVLSPSFAADKYEYAMTVPYDVNDLDISAIAKDTGAVVEILGSEDLDYGKNIVKVKVTDTNGFVKVYKVVVTKEEKAAFKLFGLSLPILGVIGGSLLLLLLMLILLKRRSNEAPSIEFNPEFNFNSKNYSDDDKVEGDYIVNEKQEKLSSPKVIDATLIERENLKEIPYDPYDEIVTKDEIVDAIQEAIDTKDPSMLEMLLEQENLNRKKEELKNKEQENSNGNEKHIYTTREERHREEDEEKEDNNLYL